MSEKIEAIDLHKPKCECCGATKGLYFFPRPGFFLCEVCLKVCLRILELCEGGIDAEELEFRLRVEEGEPQQ